MINLYKNKNRQLNTGSGFFLYLLLSICLLLVLSGCQTLSNSNPGPSDGNGSGSSSQDASKALNAYFEALKTNDILQQKKLTSEKALRFTLFKELEAELASNTKIKTTVATPDLEVISESNTMVKFKGSILMATIQTKGNASSVTPHRFADPIMVKNSKGVWKLSDFVRDGKAISQTVFTIDKSAKTKNFNIKIIDLLLSPRRSILEVMVQNTSSDDVLTMIEQSSLSILASDDTLIKKLPVQTHDPILKKYHYIEKDEKLTGILGFKKASADARNFLFELKLTSDDVVTYKIGLPDL